MTHPTRDRTAEFLRGLAAYDAGEHYEAHEHWEAIWQDESDDDRSRFVQALIQLASAAHKAKNDVAPRGALTLIERARMRLEGLPASYFGIDLEHLRPQLQRFHAAVVGALERGDGHCRLADEHIPVLHRGQGDALYLQDTPQPTVPAAARSAWFDRGLEAYANGDYFEAHELWEELWRDEPAGDDRQLLQGLIQVAAAMHKAITQGQPRPASRLLGRALSRLRNMAPDAWNLQLTRLVRESEKTRQQLIALSERGSGTIDPSAAPTIARRLA